jgi:hypothetical protein
MVQLDEVRDAINVRSAILEANAYINPGMVAPDGTTKPIDIGLDKTDTFSTNQGGDVAATPIFNKLHHMISSEKMSLFKKSWHFSNIKPSSFIDLLLKLYMLIVIFGLIGIIWFVLKDQ